MAVQLTEQPRYGGSGLSNFGILDYEIAERVALLPPCHKLWPSISALFTWGVAVLPTCASGHENSDGQNFCGRCGLPLISHLSAADPPRGRWTGVPGSTTWDNGPLELAVGQGVQVVDPKGTYKEKIGIVEQISPSGSEVRVAFFGGSVTASFRREALRAVAVSPEFRRSFWRKPHGEPAACVNGHYDPNGSLRGGSRCRYCGEPLEAQARQTERAPSASHSPSASGVKSHSTVASNAGRETHPARATNSQRETVQTEWNVAPGRLPNAVFGDNRLFPEHPPGAALPPPKPRPPAPSAPSHQAPGPWLQRLFGSVRNRWLVGVGAGVVVVALAGVLMSTSSNAGGGSSSTQSSSDDWLAAVCKPGTFADGHALPGATGGGLCLPRQGNNGPIYAMTYASAFKANNDLVMATPGSAYAHRTDGDTTWIFVAFGNKGDASAVQPLTQYGFEIDVAPQRQ